MFNFVSIMAILGVLSGNASGVNYGYRTIKKDLTIEELLAPQKKETTHEGPVAGQRYIPVLDLDTEVSSYSVDPLIAEIAKDNEDKAEKIILRIDSPGGSVFDGLRLASAIERSAAPVVCIVDMGMAASMAAYILESCHERVVTRRSLLMFHSPGGGFQGQPAHVREFLKQLEALDEAMASQYARRSKLSYDQWRERLKDDKAWWMTWRVAKKYGVVDKVVDSGEAYIKKLKR